MGRRLPYKIAGTAPEVIELVRNKCPISASRVLLGEIEIIGRSSRVADPAWVADVPSLPVNISGGTYPVYAYEWSHRRGPITVCVVILFLQRRWTMSRRLRITNDIRPDLRDGVIIVSGEIVIAGGNQIAVPSGLGDGYYPIIENRFLGFWTQSLIIDFEIYTPRNYGVGHGLSLDEYGIPNIRE